MQVVNYVKVIVAKEEHGWKKSKPTSNQMKIYVDRPLQRV